MKKVDICNFQTLRYDFRLISKKSKICILYFQLFLALALFFPTLKAEIIETSDIAKIVSHVDKDTLVLLDIDNTIIQLPQTLGTPEWFSDFHKKKLAMGVTQDNAMKETVEVYIRVNQKSEAIPVDLRTSEIIKKLQKQGTPVLGLTSRDDILSKTTLKQLKSIKINFDNSRFGHYQIKLKSGEKSKVQDGIIFTGGKHKGNCLQEFLTAVSWSPKKIIFVDDQLKAIQEVEATVSKANINYIGIRYSYLDHKAKMLNSKIADIQLKHFNHGRLLSDKEALAMIENP